MDWEDRQRFLEVVGPFRLFAGINAVTASFGMLGLVGTIVRASFEIGNIGILLRDLVALGAYFVVLYLQWINWRFAATIAATAGGTTSSMREWSRLQLRVVWLNLIYLLLHYLDWTLDWGRFFFTRLSNL